MKLCAVVILVAPFLLHWWNGKEACCGAAASFFGEFGQAIGRLKICRGSLPVGVQVPLRHHHSHEAVRSPLPRRERASCAEERSATPGDYFAGISSFCPQLKRSHPSKYLCLVVDSHVLIVPSASPCLTV